MKLHTRAAFLQPGDVLIETGEKVDHRLPDNRGVRGRITVVMEEHNNARHRVVFKRDTILEVERNI
jgi:hypothetical protein